MVKPGNTFSLFPPPDSATQDNILILDEYLKKRLFQTSPAIRFVVVPSEKIKTVLYIRNFEKLFPGITNRNGLVSQQEFSVLAEIYITLKHYFKIFCGDSLSLECMNTRFELLSKVFDIEINEFLLIDALRMTN